jgi:hypothetical protein
MDKTKVLAEFSEIPDSVDLGFFYFFSPRPSLW